MPDPTTPEARTELRAAAEAVGKRTRWTWDRVGETFYVHESAWNVATISCGAGFIRTTSDPERANIERRIATFIAAADPESVCKLLDALDQATVRADQNFRRVIRTQNRADRLAAALVLVREAAGDLLRDFTANIPLSAPDPEWDPNDEFRRCAIDRRERVKRWHDKLIATLNGVSDD